MKNTYRCATVGFLAAIASSQLLAHGDHHTDAMTFAHQAEHLLMNSLFLLAAGMVAFKLYSVLKSSYWRKTKPIE